MAESKSIEIRPQAGPQEDFLSSSADIVIFGGSAGGGKALKLDTPIPTPAGFTPIGDLRAGDTVFGADGAQVRVTHAYDPLLCDGYLVRFDDGSEIIASADHLWSTLTAADLTALSRRTPEYRAARRARRASRATGRRSQRFTESLIQRNQENPPLCLDPPVGSVKATRDIAATLRLASGRTNHAIPLAGPLQTEDACLPLDPYVFGAWLGDGSKGSGQLHGIDDQVFQEVAKAGWTSRPVPSQSCAHRIDGLTAKLKGMGVLGAKRVPPEYMRASAAQRLSLLQGLMDTDGHCNINGKVEFCNTNRLLADAVLDLATSLGQKPSMCVGRATLYGKDCGEKYRVQWVPNIPVFRLNRKVARQNDKPRRTTRMRYIVSCEPIGQMWMRCIAVDATDKLFLAGTAMIPTHNSFAILMEPLRHANNPDFGAVIFRRTMPQIMNEGGLWDDSANIYSTLAEPVTSPYPQWRFPSGAKVSFRHLEHDKTVLDWQGSQVPLLCCEVGTIIQKADGTSVPVGALVHGDRVKTLSGVGIITGIGERRHAPCVECRTDDGFTQIQTTDHELLTASGWFSYDTACESHQHRGKETSTQRRSGHKSALSCGATLPFLQRCLERFSSRLARISRWSRSLSDRLSWLEPSVYTARPASGSGCEWFRCNTRARERRPSTPLQPGLAQRFHALAGDISVRALGACVTASDRLSTSLASYRDRCWPCCGLCGAQADVTGGNSPAYARRLNDVVRQTQMGWPSGDPGIARTRTRHKLRYVHPYTGAEQTAESAVFLSSVTLTPCGPREVIDITVSDQCHYLTEIGAVNKNCFDEVTHFTAHQFWYMLSRNRSTCGVNPYVRATCNPDPDSFVARLIEWWIDQDTGYAIHERSGVIRYMLRVGGNIEWANTSEELEKKYPEACYQDVDGEPVKIGPKSFTFIKSSVEDNKELLRVNPEYLSNLNALPPTERERLKNGNWKVRDEQTIIYKPSWWKIWPKDKPTPRILHAFAAWDTAFTAADQRIKGDGKPIDQSKIAYSACLVFGVWLDQHDVSQQCPEGRHKLLLLSAWWGRVDWDDLLNRVKMVGEKKLKRPTDAHVIEEAASGRSVIQALRRNPNNRIIGIKPTGGDGKMDAKVLRAYLSQPYLKSGMVWAPDLPWVQTVITWLAGFPGGSPPSADLADCMSMAIQHLSQGYWIHHPDDELVDSPAMLAAAAQEFDPDDEDDVHKSPGRRGGFYS